MASKLAEKTFEELLKEKKEAKKDQVFRYAGLDIIVLAEGTVVTCYNGYPYKGEEQIRTLIDRWEP